VDSQGTGGPGRTRNEGDRTVPHGVVLLIALLAGTASTRDVRAGEKVKEKPSAISPLADGARVFHAKGCDRCHAISGAAGERRAGPDLVGGRSWQDVMQFAGTLWNHTPRMLEAMREQEIERPTMSPEEMEKLVGYLFYLSFLDEPGDAQRGRELFEKRSCGRCHQLAGRGGSVGPRLDELAPYATSLFMAQALWNHGPQMAAKMAELGLEWPRLEAADLAHILAFIRGKERPPASLERVSAECGSPRAGKALFEQRGCLGCHAVAGNGGRVGPDLGAPHRWRNFAEMAGTLWNHGPVMWVKMKERGVPFARVGEREMADIMAYLYFVQFTADGGDPTRGGRIFREKSCAGCHAAGTEGPAVGPNLAASEAPRSSLHWASAMWNHALAMEVKLRQTGIPWPRFEDDEMRDLVAFLHSRREAR